VIEGTALSIFTKSEKENICFLALAAFTENMGQIKKH